MSASANGKELKLEIRIAGAIDKTFGNSLSKAQKQVKKTAEQISQESVKGFVDGVKQVDDNLQKMASGFDNALKFGKKAFKKIANYATVAATAVSAVAVAVAKTGTEFESAFAGVKKTVDATEKEFDRLRQDVIDLSTEIPSTAEEIAGVMEIAGQLGINNDGLVEFTKTMINLGVSTNMTAEDAASALARFANITNMADFGPDGISNWERLGATIVDLGNNFATTEEEITEMSFKLASTGHIVGLSESEILGLSAAMSAAGIKAEAGGSAMSKILKKMQLAVEINSEGLKQYAAVAGMTAEEFATVFKTDAAGALTEFVKGLTDTERNGKSAVAVLDDMGITEIRLSNMLLALSNSSDVMVDAINTANKAWGEGTALQIEAGKRYETLESQTKIMVNSLKETGIAIYDEVRDPAMEVIKLITSKIQDFTDVIKSPNGISKWITDIGNALPTLQRKIKKYGGAVLDFLNPVLEVGKWFLKNPDVIVGAIVGIGTALTAYKIASTLSSIVKSVTEMVTNFNPYLLAINLIVTAIGAAAGAFAAFKVAQQEAVDKDLEEHFGKIALSMQNIQDIADYIIGSESLTGVKNALKQFEELDGLSESMQNSLDEINKLNWKVSIGMELKPDEQESYKTAIKEYVEAAEKYAEQAHYAVTLNIEVAGVDDNVVSQIERFYSDSESHMASLGSDLNRAVNDAFNDGLLSIDEQKTIANIQKQMADIQTALSIGDYEASMALLNKKYSGANLNADAFQNLQAELEEQSAAAIEAYQESYRKNYAATYASYNAGYLTDEQLNSTIAQLDKNLANETAMVELKSLEFQMNTMFDTYGSEIEAFTSAIDAAIQEYTGPEYEYQWSTTPGAMWQTIMQDVMNADIPDSSRGAVQQLLENMSGGLEQLNKMLENSELTDETRQRVNAAVLNADLLKGFTARYGFLGTNGDNIALSTYLAQVVSGMNRTTSGPNLASSVSAHLAAITNETEGNTTTLYDWVDTYFDTLSTHTRLGSESTKTEIENAVDTVYGYAETYMKLKFSDFNPLNINTSSLPGFGKWPTNHANGGLVNSTELSWLAERGPEMVVPLDGSSRAVSLWERAGQLLGMGGRLDGLSLGSDGGGMAVSYSPTLQFYGDAPSQNDISSALRISQDEFEMMMQRYMKNNRRLAY